MSHIFRIRAPFSPSKGSSGRSISVWVRPNLQTNSSTLKLKKQTSKDSVRLRRSDTETSSQAQWYAPELLTKPDNNQSQPVIELSEHLSTQRPLRSEYDRRLSRPTSGQYRSMSTSSPTRSLSHGASSNSLLSISPHSNSFSLSDSTDDKPPPLPVKQSYADYTNLSENGNSTNGIDLTLISPKRHSGSIGSAKHKVSLDLLMNK